MHWSGGRHVTYKAIPKPGSTGYIINHDGTFRRHTDFTDTTSMYVRNLVEGLFGVRMQMPDKRVILQPSFPLEWEHASIRLAAAGYRYTWKDGIETMSIETPVELKPTVRLRARRADIEKVTINDARVAGDGRSCTIPLPGDTGEATYFVLVRHGTVEMWVPAEVDVRSGKPVNNMADAAAGKLQPHPVDLGKWVNQRLVEDRIPFAIPTEGRDAVFTSLCEQFPDRIEIPLNQRGRNVAVLAVASIPISQSRMDNGRIRVKLNWTTALTGTRSCGTRRPSTTGLARAWENPTPSAAMPWRWAGTPMAISTKSILEAIE